MVTVKYENVFMFRNHKGGSHSPTLDALDLSSDEQPPFPENDNSEDTILGSKVFSANDASGSRNGTLSNEIYLVNSNSSR